MVRVIGPVVDVEFPPAELPEIHTALTVDLTLESETTTITCEVAQHIGDSIVRTIALKPTDGLVRGTPVENTGSPISVPVGEGVLGHVYNVIGEPLDADAVGDPRERPLADPPGAPAVLGARAEEADARDGHQGDRPPGAVRAGREDRDVRRRRRRQDRDHPGDDPPAGEGARRCVGLRRRGGADPRGQRPLPRDDGVGGHQQHRARVRPDGRAARRPAPRRAVRAHDGRVLPRRRAEGRAAVHRQHLPVHAGGLRGLDAARTDAERGRLSADPRRRDGRAAGADHVGGWPVDHVAAGDLRAGRRHHGPGAAHGVRAPRRHDGALARHRGARDLSGRGPARLHVADPRRAVRRTGALRHGAPRAGDPPAVPRPPGHHRDPRDRRAVRGGQGDRRRAPARSSGSSRSRSSSRSSSPASPGSTRRSTRRSRPSRRSARASTTISPSRRSSSSAGSRRPSSRRRPSRPRSGARGPRRHAGARGLGGAGDRGDRARCRRRRRDPRGPRPAARPPRDRAAADPGGGRHVAEGRRGRRLPPRVDRGGRVPGGRAGHERAAREPRSTSMRSGGAWRSCGPRRTRTTIACRPRSRGPRPGSRCAARTDRAATWPDRARAGTMR